MKGYALTSYIEKVFETQGETADWGGYYNYNFLSEDKTKLLCNRAAFDGRSIEKGDVVEVGYYDIPSGIWHKLDESDSFNWPQATMLQWVPNTNNKEVVFNLSNGERLISRVINIETGESRDLAYPIYCLTPDGKKAITLNLERSYWTPAYHYQSVKNEKCNVDVLEGDGIFELDLQTGSIKTIVSLDDVLKLQPDSDFDKGKHWLEHIMINPSGTEIVFLHRYFLPGSSRLTRMVMANIDGTNAHVVEGWQKFAWSHFGWKTDNSFVMFARIATRLSSGYVSSQSNTNPKPISKPSAIATAKRIVRKMIASAIPKSIKAKMANHNEYQMYEKMEGHYKLKTVYKGKLLDIDGHPSFTLDGKYMITDTYADTKKIRKLLVLNTENGKRMLLGRFYSPFWGTPASCDLHPKMSHDREYVVIDTAYSGKHRMMVLKLNWRRIKEVIG